jgi:ABC-type Na+ transport system ATPase subunit NatA
VAGATQRGPGWVRADRLPGEIVGLVGHNGAGKTTFVEIVSGLIRPDAGRVRVAGVDVLADPRHARARLGMCPQETSLYPRLTVAEHLRPFGALAGLRRALRRAVTGIAEQLCLTEVLDRQARLLSGWQRKRTQAATALVAERPVLLLDEPTAGRLGQVDGTAGDELRVVTSDAPATLARLLAAGAAPVSIDIRRPGLDDLYAALTP